MLEWVFGKRSRGPRAEDRFWLAHAARLRGIAREVAGLTEAGHSVLVLALAASVADELLAVLADEQPARCLNALEREALGRRLGRAGTVSVALPPALPAETPGAPDVLIDVLVCGRNASRRADEQILRFAARADGRVRVVFHVALDDPLLREAAGSIKPLLERLGASEDEPISHPFVSRAIERAQGK
ncbi:MAG: hypothetical protein M5U08_05415 [Burkholderiales bacterium]|nr:hypothetical protein [Burkholderiales bacterium]